MAIHICILSSSNSSISERLSYDDDVTILLNNYNRKKQSVIDCTVNMRCRLTAYIEAIS